MSANASPNLTGVPAFPCPGYVNVFFTSSSLLLENASFVDRKIQIRRYIEFGDVMGVCFFSPSIQYEPMYIWIYLSHIFVMILIRILYGARMCPKICSLFIKYFLFPLFGVHSSFMWLFNYFYHVNSVLSCIFLIYRFRLSIRKYKTTCCSTRSKCNCTIVQPCHRTLRDYFYS